ncbi:carbohydrate ABC transporter permease [Butyrivibrio hungatei]|uniref:carbohydrate ABC transporter permease n=1 Tax=Butyrivibrio hungatei TaxID=185008 RepID=UPI001FA7DAEE|nr:sugar ABC transporter permease [Butyrivibrio hungatei]
MANYRTYPHNQRNYPRNQKTVRIKKAPKVNPIVKYFKELGTCLAEGSTCVKLSTVFMGLGHIYNYQFIKGVLVFIVQALFIVYLIFGAAPNLAKFSTLGTVKREAIFDPLTMQNTVNDYDNSFMILLGSVGALFIIFMFFLFWVSNIKSMYRTQLLLEARKHVNTFSEDFKELLGEKFHITLLSFPILGVILMNIIPILILITIAFTNYDQNHLPPSELFTWVGFRNFVKLFTQTTTSSFGYAFRRILEWTFLWAFFATVSNFLLGHLIALLINSKLIKLKRFWRTLFIVTIAVPQFVTLLLIRNFLADSGIVNSICSSMGITAFLQNVGLVSKNISYIPFLTSPGWAKVTIVIINIWVGIPYQILISTGILLNIPRDQIEAAMIDRASPYAIFKNVTMPYVMFVEGPTLVTDFVRNINNFNIIYLLTQDVYVTTDQALANSHGKEVDLLVTWLFRLTNEYYDYKMASVIGVIVFSICSIFTILSFSRIVAGEREEVFM